MTILNKGLTIKQISIRNRLVLPPITTNYGSSEGLVTEDDVIKARLYQKQTNRRIGDRLMEKGWVTEDDIQKVLVIQEESMTRFGEIATGLGLLSMDQVREVVEVS